METVNLVAEAGSTASRTKKPIRVLQLTSSLGFYGAEQMIMTLITALDRELFDVRLATLEKKRVSSNAIVSTARAAGVDAVTFPCRGGWTGERYKR